MSENEIGVEGVNAPEQIQLEKNKKNKAKFLIGGLLVIVAIAIGLFVGYKKLNNDPVGIYKDTINSVYKSLSSSLKEAKKNNFTTIDLNKEPIVVKLNAKLDSNVPELKNFTGLNYNISSGIDVANKKMNVEMGISENNKSIISLVMSVINKNIYLKSEELYDKVLDLGEEDIFGDMDINPYFKVNGNDALVDYDNYEYILKELKKIFIDSLDKSQFVMENEKITIGSKEYAAKKATYKLDKANIERTYKYINDCISKDEKLVKAIAESLGLTADKVKEQLAKETDMSKYKDSSMVLYVDKFNELIAGAFYEEDTRIFKFDCVNDEVNVSIESDSIKIELNKDKNEIVTIKLYQANSEVVNLIIENDDDKVKIDYRMSASGVTGSGTLEINNVESSSDKVSADIKFSLNVNALGQNINFAIDGSYSVEKASVETLDSTNSVKIDNISEEEAMEIFTKLSPILERFGLSELMGSIM